MNATVEGRVNVPLLSGLLGIFAGIPRMVASRTPYGILFVPSPVVARLHDTFGLDQELVLSIHRRPPMPNINHLRRAP